MICRRIAGFGYLAIEIVYRREIGSNLQGERK
jgi:hypothetical protein